VPINPLPRTADEFFDSMGKKHREKLERELRRAVWEYATATACAVGPDGKRIGGIMDDALRGAIGDASLSIYMEDPSADQ
jgi:hypothetical protein